MGSTDAEANPNNHDPVEVPQNERQNMNTRFDELTKGLAQSVTRRAALKKCGVGLAGMALACFGLANKGHAQSIPCQTNKDCGGGFIVCCKTKSGNYCLAKAFCKGGTIQFP